MNKKQQIEEIAKVIPEKIKDPLDNSRYIIFGKSLRREIARIYYNAGYRKIDEFAECRNCTAWSGTDCTRHPYTQGCLKDENNIKRQAVKEFAEKLKDYLEDKLIDEFEDMASDVKYLTIDIDEFEEYIDELLKEYENDKTRSNRSL